MTTYFQGPGGSSQHLKFILTGTERGYVNLFSKSGKPLFHWKPHSEQTHAVKINGDFAVSVGDLTCVFCISRRTWIKLDWNQGVDLTDVEWMNSTQYLVADSNGAITLDIADESRLVDVSHD